MTKLTTVILLLILTSCGWQLHGYESYRVAGEQRIDSIDLVADINNRLFHTTLIQQIEDLSIAVDTQSPIRLIVRDESTEKRPLSYGSTGIPIQYQLIMSIRFAYTKDKTLEPIERRFVARRQYDFDADLIIAKHEEERSLLQEMRVELANRILATVQN